MIFRRSIKIHSEAGHPILAQQVQLNQGTANNWELFTAHRQKVTNLILSNWAKEAGRLCVLGAGNCNDLDLPLLAHRFAEIHLVDLDDRALSAGASRQLGGPVDSVVFHGGIDLMGVIDELARWHIEAPTEPEIEALLKQIEGVSEPGIGEPFDAVISTTVLTQLIASAVMALGADHPRLFAVILAIRIAHVRLLVNLVATGGAGVFVGDLVSSDTCQELNTVSDNELPTLMQRLIHQRNFFTGTNPFILKTILQEDPYISSRITEVTLENPWQWRISPSRTYLVYGLTFRKV